MRLLKTKDKAQLTMINKKYEGHKSAFLEKCKALLQEWNGTSADEPKWEHVIGTLKGIRLHNLARELEKALQPVKPHEQFKIDTKRGHYDHQGSNSGNLKIIA